MKKINKLIKKQEAALPKYLAKWLANGRSTERINKEETIQAVKTIYKCAGMKEPKHFFFFPSPIQCQLAVNIMRSEEFKVFGDLDKRSNLWSNLWSNLELNLRSNLESNLGSNLGSNLRSNLRSNLELNLWSNLGSNLRSNLRSNLWSNLELNLWSNLWSNLSYSNTFYGNYWTDWVGFYDFILNEIFESQIPHYQDFIAYMNAIRNVHLFIPYEDIVFISDRPTEINLNASGRLHHIDKPAMMYEDGYSLFFMNGVQVPKEFIETPKETIDKTSVLKLANVDQRLQIMKKVGVGHFISSFEQKLLDKKDAYELLLLKINNEECEFLKMVNPSTGEIHLEGVNPGIRTVTDALAWRNGLEYWINPLALT